MKTYFLFLIVLFCMVNPTITQAQDPNLHIYLAFGQSNMEGQGLIEPQDKTGVDDRFKVMGAVNCSGDRTHQLGKLTTAVPPVVRCNTGLGILDYFGRTMVQELPSGVKIVVVPVAVAGSSIDLFDKDNYASYAATAPSWMKGIIDAYGGNPYARMVEVAKLAQKEGVIKGILFHQGETNTNDPNWKYKVANVVKNLKADLQLGDVPFLAGEMLSTPYACCSSHNVEVNKLPTVIPNAHVISSAGLLGADQAHFTSESYREFGKRYAKKMFEQLGADTIPCLPPAVTPSQSFTINDLAENNTLVGTVTATDPDANTTFQDWQITGGTGADMFSINQATGAITVSNRALLDFENTRSYTLNITVGDGVNRSEAATVTIHLVHAPVITAAQVFQINQWVTDNYVVGNALATDKDENTTLGHWKITGGTGASLFAINASTGEIKATNSSTLNFSNTYSYTLELSVSDGTNESLPASVTITLSERVDICHAGTTMSVRRAKVPDHIKHGDATSACESVNSTQAARMAVSKTSKGESKHSEIRVYPNPSRGEVSVDLGANLHHIRLVQVLDMTGKMVRQMPVNGASVVRFTNGKLKPGMYILRMQGDEVVNRRIVVQ